MPQSFSNEPDSGSRIAEFVGFVEGVGFDSLWVQEQMLGKDPSLEPLNSLAFAAAVSSRVRLGTATVVGPLRDPVLLAKVTATVDRLSAGRLILGLSIGEVAQIYEAIGVDMAHRGRRLDEMVDVLVGLWTQAEATHHGNFWHFDDAPMEPKPVQNPHPEIWFGGHSRVALRRVARAGSGWIGAGGSSVSDFAQGEAILSEELEAAGRSREEVTVAKKLYVAISDRPDEARRRLEDWFCVHWLSSFDPKAMASRVGVAGDAEMVASTISETVESGADLVILNPVYDEADQAERLVAAIQDHRLGLERKPS
jgi:probable F420-dependent oxidoreductase